MTKNTNVQNNGSDNVEIVKQKRGRKPKKIIVDTKQDEVSLENNIIFSIQESIVENETNDVNDFLNKTENENEEENEILMSEIVEEQQKPGGKKRGRKPKGGKIIQQIVSNNNNKETKPNIILHLKCFLKDLESTTIFGNNLESFNFSGKNDITYEIIGANESISKQISTSNINDNVNNDDEYYKNKENDVKDVWKKLKVLEHNLHVNNISDKKAACFWCTCEFDNPPVYIPKHFINNSYHVYGCFCSPECATAHLMEENIDSSSKFERYHLINHIYSKIYDYKKNIKPAPNPFYLLDKYYGNLTIQEFRSLLRNERLFLVVDKPLTRILPELHEDNDDFIINNKIIPANNFLIKNKLQKKQTKNTILNEKFGLGQ